MVKRVLALTLTIAMCMGMAACSGTGKKPAEDTTAVIIEDDTGAEEDLNGETGMVNPMTEVTYEEMIDRTGIDLPAPDGASDVVYYIVETDEYTISQMDFTLDGNSFTLRACSTGMTELDAAITGEDEMDLQGFDFDQGDISGLYYDWTSAGTDLVKDRSAIYHLNEKEGVGYISWLDVAPGVLYNLIMTENADHELLTKTAEKVFVPVQGEVQGE